MDVSVIGSGPAGSIAAKLLCDEGFSVTVYEKDTIPRHKHCAGFVSARSIKILESIGIDCTSTIRQPISGYKVRCKDETYDFIPKDKGVHGGNVHREEFDTFLVDQAKESGAIVKDGTRVTEINDLERGHTVITANGSEDCDFIVGADGVNSLTRKHLGIKYDKNKIGVALEAEVKVGRAIFDHYNGSNFYNMGSFDCGYSWVFPKIDGETVNVGTCVWVQETKKMQGTLMDMLSMFLDSLEWYDGQKIVPHGHLIPFMGTVNKLGKGNIILTGDAAGFVGVAGEGIPYAIDSGIHAADAIIRHSNGEGTVQSLYEKNCRDMVNYLNWMMPWVNRVMFSPGLLKHVLGMTKRNEGFKNNLIDLMAHAMSINDVMETVSIGNVLRALW